MDGNLPVRLDTAVVWRKHDQGFVPIPFMTGYARRFTYPFGWMMAFSIMVSMFVSFTLTPMLSFRFLKLSDALSDTKTKESKLFRKMDQGYVWVSALGSGARDGDHRDLGGCHGADVSADQD